MSDQMIIVCDDRGNPTEEYVPKEVGHTGGGRRHLAITVLLYNQTGQVLLQRRKHEVFDNIWDFTASTHPLHLDGVDESIKQATLRALKVEYGIQNVSLKKIGEFNYFAQVGQFCENEHCYLLIGEYNGQIKMDPSIGYEYRWIDKKEFLNDVDANPQKYAPWVIEGMKILKKVFG